MNDKFDALLIVSFGGPEGMNDVMPFLENVVRGRNVPRERLLGVAHHYELFGGVSPINQQNRNLIAALAEELRANGPALPIYWGNRNWHPLLPDTLRQMAADGIRNALAFVTSAYSSYSSCRQYLQNISDAQAVVGPDAPRVEKLRVFYNHPLFIEANVDHIRAALNEFEEPVFRKYPELREIKEELYKSGAEYASMTGTGSSLYGIFHNSKKTANLLAGEKYRVHILNQSH